MYLLRETSRSPSGAETSKNFVFQTIEDLSEFVYSTWYDMFCDDWGFPANWDSKTMGCEFPSKEEFAPKLVAMCMADWNETGRLYDFQSDKVKNFRAPE